MPKWNDEWMKECEKTAVLLLEGSSDCHIIKKFCKNNDIELNFGFCNCESDSKVLPQLNALLLKGQTKIVGIILDADNDIGDRYQKIKESKVGKFYKKLPISMPKSGLIHVEDGLPKLGIWIMPNNRDSGALEDFYLKLATNINTKFINGLINQAKSKNLTSFKPQHRKKAIMHTYFAWQDTPGMPLHSSINKIALDNEAGIADKFKSWLIELFS